MHRIPKFYIAGPFFNEPQLKLIEEIELAFVDHSVPAFSPRTLDRGKGPAQDDAEWQRRFWNNVENLVDCDHVLAVADFKLPEGARLRICAKDNSGEPQITVGFPPLHLPDTGTVFEMGVQFGMWLVAMRAKIDFYDRERHAERKIVLYTERPLTETLNVMLTKSCHGVLHGKKELDSFLNSGDINWTVPGPWKGKTR
jgi:nucleoside 2-deoxyribosyltransferase